MMNEASHSCSNPRRADCERDYTGRITGQRLASRIDAPQESRPCRGVAHFPGELGREPGERRGQLGGADALIDLRGLDAYLGYDSILNGVPVRSPIVSAMKNLVAKTSLLNRTSTTARVERESCPV
jgi:hypothetical protein